MGRMETARAGWLCLLHKHKGELAVLAFSLDAFRLPCEGKSGLLRGFKIRRSSFLMEGGRRGRGSASASWLWQLADPGPGSEQAMRWETLYYNMCGSSVINRRG